MKKKIGYLLLSVSALFVSVNTSNASEANKTRDPWSFLPATVATYGNKSISKQDFLSEIEYISQTDLRELPKGDLKPLAKKVINQMINESILLKYAEEDGIKPQKEIVKQEFQTFLKSLTKQEYAAFVQSLKSKQSTLQSYEQKLCDNKEAQIGLTVHKWAEAEFKKHIKVTEAEVKAYYKTNKAQFKHDYVNVSHILITPDSDKPASQAKAKQEAEKIYNKLMVKPADFNKLAKEVSHCESGKETQGFLGPIAPGDLKKDFKHLEKVLFSMKDGEISKPQKSPKGYHIIKVEHPGYETLESVTPYITSELRSQKQKQKIDQLIATERKKLAVKFNF